MDPVHVVSLAGDKLDQCRRRIQRAITGRRGRAGDRLYRARRTLHTGADLLTDTQTERLEALFADERHAAVQASWGVYQRLIQAYRTDEAGLGKYLMQRLIDSLRQAVPDGLEEIQTLARTLISPGQDVLAYFDRPGTSNGPTPSHQRTPGTPTRHRPGLCATWPATPSAASSTPDASKTTWQQSPKAADKPRLQHPQTRRATNAVNYVTKLLDLTQSNRVVIRLNPPRRPTLLTVVTDDTRYRLDMQGELIAEGMGSPVS